MLKKCSNDTGRIILSAAVIAAVLFADLRKNEVLSNSIFSKDIFINSYASENQDFVDENIISRNISDRNIYGGIVDDSELSGDFIDSADVVDSIITNSTVYDSNIKESAVDESELFGGEVSNSAMSQDRLYDVSSHNNEIDNSYIKESESVDDTIQKSTIEDSSVTGSKTSNSTLKRSVLEGAEVNDSVLTDITSQNSSLNGDEVYTSEIGGGTVKNSVVIDSSVDGGNIIGSTISGNTVLQDTGTFATVSGNAVAFSTIYNSDVNNRLLQDSVVNNSNITNGSLFGSSVSGSTLLNSYINTSTISGSTLNGITGYRAVFVGNTIIDSELRKSSISGNVITDGTIDNSTANDIDVTDTVISDSYISGGTLRNSTNKGTTTFRSFLSGVAGFLESTIEDVIENSNLTSSRLTDSFVKDSNITNSTISGSTFLDDVVDGGYIYKSYISGNTLLTDTVSGHEAFGNRSRDYSNKINALFAGDKTISGSTISGNSLTDLGMDTINTVSGNSIINTWIKDSEVNNRRVDYSDIISSTVKNSELYKDSVFESAVLDSHLVWSSISGSTIADSEVNHGTVSGSTITGTALFSAEATNVNSKGNEWIRTYVNRSLLTEDTIYGGTVSGSEIRDGRALEAVLNKNDITGTQLISSRIDEGTVGDSSVDKSKVNYVNMNGGTVTNSTISGSTLVGAETKNNTILDSILNGIKAVGDYIANSSVVRGIAQAITSVASGFNGTKVTDSQLRGGSISGNSIIDKSELQETDVRNSTITNTSVKASVLDGVTLSDSTVRESILRNSVIRNVTVEDQDNFMRIIAQPIDMTVKTGDTACFNITVTGDAERYTWSYKADDSSSWTTLGNGNPCNYVVVNGFKGGVYRCSINDANGNTMISDEARIDVAQGKTLRITSQPVSINALSGSNVTLSCEAEGDGLTYQWQWHEFGNTRWSNGLGTGPSLNKTVRDIWDGRVFRCVVTDIDGNSEISDEATFSVGYITSQPNDVAAHVGDSTRFTVAANGRGLSYQWKYQKKNSSVWEDFSGGTKATLSKKMMSGWDGWKVKCVISDTYGNTMQSDIATITKVELPVITTQPKDVSARVGDSISVYIDTMGADRTYQWQYQKKNSSTWTDFSGGTKATLSKKMMSGWNGWKVRCVVADNYGGNVISDSATLSVVFGPKITRQPENVTNYVGAPISFSITAEGTGLQYQWKYLQKNGTEWTDFSGGTEPTLNKKMMSGWNGWKVRCDVTDSSGYTVTSETALLETLNGAQIIEEPADVTAKEGDAISLTVVAEGEELTYQWKYQKKNSDVWTDFSSATNATMRKKMLKSWDGWNVKCDITDKYGNSISTNVVVLSLMKGPQITSQPENVTALVGERITLSVAAEGTGLSYAWQYQGANSSEWVDFSGGNGSSLSKRMMKGWDGWKIRCLVSDSSGVSVSSDIVSLSIPQDLIIIGQPESVTGAVGDTVMFSISAEGEQLRYRWQYQLNDVDDWIDFSEGNSNELSKKILYGWDDMKVRCVIDDYYGRTVVSDIVSISVIESLQPMQVGVSLEVLAITEENISKGKQLNSPLDCSDKEKFDEFGRISNDDIQGNVENVENEADSDDVENIGNKDCPGGEKIIEDTQDAETVLDENVDGNIKESGNEKDVLENNEEQNDLDIVNGDLEENQDDMCAD